MDDAEQLMPPFLRFVRGIIDSSDLPLNVSREILQKDKRIDQIRAGSVKRVLDLLSAMAKNETQKYATFWKEFGKVLKEGIVEDSRNRDGIAKLLRYESSRGNGEVDVSLEDYVARMREGQENIYYLTADRPETARNSPHLEVFVAHDIEVLLMTDEVDEWLVHHLTEFDGKALQSVAKGELDLSAIEGVEEVDGAEEDEGHRELTEELTRYLEDRVSEVRTTHRLTSSPACLVAKDSDLGAHFERLLHAAGQTVETSKPVLEINPSHPLLVRYRSEKSESRRKDWAELLVDQATLARRRPACRSGRVRESPQRGPACARRRVREGRSFPEKEEDRSEECRRRERGSRPEDSGRGQEEGEVEGLARSPSELAGWQVGVGAVACFEELAREAGGQLSSLPRLRALGREPLRRGRTLLRAWVRRRSGRVRGPGPARPPSRARSAA